MEEKFQKLLSTIPYGEIPKPLKGEDVEVEKPILDQTDEIQVKPDFKNHVVSKLDQSEEMIEFSNLEEHVRIGKGITSQTISNYPLIKRGDVEKRDGDPTADAFAFWRCRNFVVFSVNDGCGWGVEPSYAARVASATFVLHVKKEILTGKYKTTEQLKSLIKYAIALAHQTIVDLEIPEGKNPGTCTVCAGVLVPFIDDEVFESKGIKLDEIKDDNTKIDEIRDDYISKIVPKTKLEEKYQLIGVSFGDCKTYFINKQENKYVTEDLTFGSRLKAINPNDPGGRIGFQKRPSRLIDMRNSVIFHKEMKWDDMIMVCSDGVHDNLEPKTRGYKPVEVDPNLGDIKWFKLKPNQIEEMNKDFSLKLISEIASHSVSVHQFHKIMMDAVVGVLGDRKKFMQDHPDEAVPEVFSGKLDHATLLICRPTF